MRCTQYILCKNLSDTAKVVQQCPPHLTSLVLLHYLAELNAHYVISLQHIIDKIQEYKFWPLYLLDFDAVDYRIEY